jgi:pyridoxal phosphate enzyme (YggS family)
MIIIENFINIKKQLYKLNKNINLVVVSKNQSLEKIKLLIEQNHYDFGENKVQEAYSKWKLLLSSSNKLKLHLIGKLQSNKANYAFEIFDYIHSLDNEKLAQIFSNLESKSSKKIKYFIQVNVGEELQKSGVSKDKVHQFIKYCMNDLKLNIIGLMCIPPAEGNPVAYFKSLAEIARANNLNELSMGMSNDYECAIENGATFVRIGNKIFSGN